MIRARLDSINPFLYQWDTGQYLILNGIKVPTYVYLAYEDEKDCLKVGPFSERQSRVKIPDIFLQQNKEANVYVVENDDPSTNTTKLVLNFEIKFRSKPADYVFEEEELITWSKLERRIATIEEELPKKASQEDIYNKLGQKLNTSGGLMTGNINMNNNRITLLPKAKQPNEPVILEQMNEELEKKQPAGNYLTQETDPTVPTWAKEPNKPSYTYEEVGAEAVGVAEEKVVTHNSAVDAHNDIRLKIQEIADKLNTFLDSDDQTLDQLTEIVAYIKENKTLIDSITTNKVNIKDIIDNLTTNVKNKPLSAAQGVAIKTLIDEINNSLTNKQPAGDYATKSEIPEKLPNPNAITFTGAATGIYDGSSAVTIDIPKGGGEQVQSDWNINDETNPAFIKNRICYSTGEMVEQEIVSEFTGNFTDYLVPGVKQCNTNIFPVEIGNKYSVYWDNLKYETTAEDFHGVPCLGNLSILSLPSETKEPFLYITTDGFLTKSDVLTHVIKVTREIEKIEEVPYKYIPMKIKNDIKEKTGKSNDQSGETYNDYINNTAGAISHAEGSHTDASGTVSHAEGSYTIASGAVSHAEGSYTIASSGDQHVQGKGNIEDSDNKYAHIVGNGDILSVPPTKSNAHTLDWKGNSWYQGDVLSGGADMDDPNAISLKKTSEAVAGKLSKTGHTPNKNLVTDASGNVSEADFEKPYRIVPPEQEVPYDEEHIVYREEDATGGGGADISLGMTNAVVGQIITIGAVDTEGKPTSYVPVTANEWKWGVY